MVLKRLSLLLAVLLLLTGCPHGFEPDASSNPEPSTEGEVLARGQQIREMALKDGYLYWLHEGTWNADGSNHTGGALRRLSVSGGTPSELVGNLTNPSGLLVEGGVYWSNRGSLAFNTAKGTISVIPTNGGTPNLLAQGLAGPTEIVSDSQNLYWINLHKNQIMRMAKSGGSVELVAKSSQSNLSGLLLLNDFLYWVASGGEHDEGAVLKVSKNATNATPQQLSTNVQRPTKLVTDGSFLYWNWSISYGFDSTYPREGALNRMPVGGGKEQTIVSSGHVYGMTLAGSEIFFCGDDGIKSVARDGGEPQVIAKGAFASQLQVDSSYVYWGGLQDGVIRRAPRQR